MFTIAIPRLPRVPSSFQTERTEFLLEFLFISNLAPGSHRAFSSARFCWRLPRCLNAWLKKLPFAFSDTTFAQRFPILLVGWRRLQLRSPGHDSLSRQEALGSWLLQKIEKCSKFSRSRTAGTFVVSDWIEFIKFLPTICRGPRSRVCYAIGSLRACPDLTKQAEVHLNAHSAA